MFICLIILAIGSISFNKKKSQTVTVINDTLLSKPHFEYNIHNHRPVMDLSVEVLKTSYKIMFLSLQEKPFGYGLNNYEKAFNHCMPRILYYHAIMFKGQSP